MATTWGSLYNKIFAQAKIDKTMVSASFELTARCNLKCKMCYICEDVNNRQKQERELTKEQWIDLASQARDEGLLYVTLTGGEVLLREDFKEIYEGLNGLGLLIQIYTNATMLTQELVDWLSKMPPYKVSITLYGSSRESCERVTGYADAYDRALNGIDMLLAKGIQVELKTTVVQGNANDFYELSEIARVRGLELKIVNYISPRREGCNSDPQGNRLSPEVLVAYEHAMLEHNKWLWSESRKSETSTLKEEEKVLMNDSAATENLLQDMDTGKQKETLNSAFTCSAASSAAWFTWDGRLIACGLLSHVVSYPLLIGYKEAWKELKRLSSLVSSCNECNECKYKVHCDACPARLMTETGSYKTIAPYLCDTAKERSVYYQRRVSDYKKEVIK